MLYEIFTGPLPFTGEHADRDRWWPTCSRRRPRPRSVNPRLSAELDAVILRGLEKDPARRWQTTPELLAALSAISERTEAA